MTRTVAFVLFAQGFVCVVKKLKSEVCVPPMEIAVAGFRGPPLVFVTTKSNVAELVPTFVFGNVLDVGAKSACACANFAHDNMTSKM